MEAGNKYRSFRQIVNLFYNEALEGLDETKEEIKPAKQVKIEPKFIEDSIDGNIKLEIFIGNETMYKIKKLSEFYDRMLANDSYKYGDKLEFVHTREAFEEDSLPLLDFVLKYAEIIKYGNTNSNSNYRFGATALSESKIILNSRALDSIFEILKDQTVRLEKDSEERIIKFAPRNPDIKFSLEKTGDKEYTLSPNIDMFKINISKGNKYTYLLIGSKLYRCDKEFERTTLSLLEALRDNYSPQLKLGADGLPQLFSIIMPKIKGRYKD